MKKEKFDNQNKINWLKTHSQILKISLITITISGLFITSGLWLYASRLESIGSWSKNSIDWGSFGGFISGVIGVPATLFSGILIYVTVRMQIKENRESLKSSKL